MKKSSILHIHRGYFPALLGLWLAISACSDTLPGIPLVTQEKSNWCWAAVCLSIVSYYIPDFTKTQTEVASVLTTLNIAPEPEDLITCLEENGKDVNLQAQMVMGPLPWSTMKEEADNNRPIFFLIRWTNGAYHSNVFCGYIGDSTKLKYMDPGNGRYILRTYNGSISIDNGVGTWERSFLTTATIAPIINRMSPQSPNTVFKVVRYATTTNSAITFILETPSVNNNLLQIFNTAGSCIYKTMVHGPKAAVVWENEPAMAAGTYVVAVDEITGLYKRHIAVQPFTIVK